MTACRRATFLTTLTFLWLISSVPLLAQQTAGVVTPVLSPEEMEKFLLTARIVRTRTIETGINDTSRATLSDGTITHDAHIQTVDVSRTTFVPSRGPIEMNFKDTYRYNIAGYRLARLLGIKNVPMSVERYVGRSNAAVTWWVDDVLMDEGARQKKGTPKEWDPERTSSQIYIMRVFDELIANQDRNLGNLLWTSAGQMWMIDHTRAFRTTSTLKNPNVLLRCEKSLFDALRALTLESMTKAIGNWLEKPEIEAVLKRRTAIVDLFDAKIKQRGEQLVLYTVKEP